MFRPYPDYRRTDLNWFEYLPESWAIMRTKQMFRLVIEKAPANNKMELLHVSIECRDELALLRVCQCQRGERSQIPLEGLRFNFLGEHSVGF